MVRLEGASSDALARARFVSPAQQPSPGPLVSFGFQLFCKCILFLLQLIGALAFSSLVLEQALSFGAQGVLCLLSFLLQRDYQQLPLFLPRCIRGLPCKLQAVPQASQFLLQVAQFAYELP